MNGEWRALIRRKDHESISKRFPTRAAARVWAREIEGQIDQGRTVQVLPKVTVADLISAYRGLRDRALKAMFARYPRATNSSYWLQGTGRFRIRSYQGRSRRHGEEMAQPEVHLRQVPGACEFGEFGPQHAPGAP